MILSDVKLVVTGGRDYDDRATCFDILDCIHAEFTISVLISGMARGLDRLAVEWAEARGVTVDPHPVTNEDWVRLGKRAGHIRNQAMIDVGKPDVAVVFPGGNGTRDMKARLLKYPNIFKLEVDKAGGIQVL